LNVRKDNIVRPRHPEREGPSRSSKTGRNAQAGREPERQPRKGEEAFQLKGNQGIAGKWGARARKKNTGKEELQTAENFIVSKGGKNCFNHTPSLEANTSEKGVNLPLSEKRGPRSVRLGGCQKGAVSFMGENTYMENLAIERPLQRKSWGSN